MGRYTVIYKSILALVVMFALFAFTVNFAVIPKKTAKKEIAKKELVSDVRYEIDAKIEKAYSDLQANDFELPSHECFEEGLKGFYLLKEKGIIKHDVLTLIDFGLSSGLKRLWIIDLVNNKVLLQTYVAHGLNTGDVFATNFSNAAESFKSSLGFYATAEVYNGKHGTSLRLDGLEKNINDNARNRAVVLHGANYVSETYIKKYGRVGRSLGCPAVPVECVSDIISMIKGKSCLYIYHPSIDSSIKEEKLSS